MCVATVCNIFYYYVGLRTTIRGFENHNHFNNLVRVSLKARGFMQSNTIFTLSNARLDKTEIDILQYINSWLPTFTRFGVFDLAEKCDLFASDATAAVDMLILHGLLENDGDDELMGRMVQVPDIAQEWLTENTEAVNSLQYMSDTDLFTEDETAIA